MSSCSPFNIYVYLLVNLSVPVATMDAFEDFVHSLRPELWLIYHVNLKAIQCGSVMGIASFVLNVPVYIRSSSNQYVVNTMGKTSFVDMLRLRRHLYQAFVCGITLGIGVTMYNLWNLEFDILEDRVYRIIGSTSQKEIDYSSIIGGIAGLAFSVRKLVRSTETTDECTLREKPTPRPTDYRSMAEFVLCNALGGVAVGVVAHIIRTQNYVSPKRLWRYTSQCWA